MYVRFQHVHVLHVYEKFVYTYRYVCASIWCMCMYSHACVCTIIRCQYVHLRMWTYLHGIRMYHDVLLSAQICPQLHWNYLSVPKLLSLGPETGGPHSGQQHMHFSRPVASHTSIRLCTHPGAKHETKAPGAPLWLSGKVPHAIPCASTQSDAQSQPIWQVDVEPAVLEHLQQPVKATCKPWWASVCMCI